MHKSEWNHTHTPTRFPSISPEKVIQRSSPTSLDHTHFSWILQEPDIIESLGLLSRCEEDRYRLCLVGVARLLRAMREFAGTTFTLWLYQYSLSFLWFQTYLWLAMANMLATGLLATLLASGMTVLSTTKYCGNIVTQRYVDLPRSKFRAC